MTLPVVGVVSTYREGALAADAVSSLLPACDRVLVLEGAVGEPQDSVGESTQLVRRGKVDGRVSRRDGGPWASDAAKRTQLLRWAQEWTHGRPFWLVVLDGDEILLYGEQLRAYLDRAACDEAGAMRLKLVQTGDDSCEVQETSCRVLPGHLLESYVLSSFHVKLQGVETVLTLPHGPAKRAPIAGEPHIVHRPHLRPPRRQAPELRLSEHERRDLVGLGFHHLEQPPALTPAGVVDLARLR